MAFNDAWAALQEQAAADVERYGENGKGNAYKARSALATLYASSFGYDEWKDVGIAFKAAGGTLSDWLAWCSIDAARYDEKVATDLYNHVEPDGPITDKSLWKRAWDAGWDWHERYDALPKVKQIPKPVEYDTCGAQAIAQLEAMFNPDEYVNIVTEATRNNKGKWVPKGYGRQFLVRDLCESIRKFGLERALDGYNHDAGVWLRVNPTNGRGISDSDVAAFRNALVESDDMPLKDQERMLFELGLPISCITTSGGKSLHAIVRVDADGPQHFRDRVEYMHAECERAGMSIDKANKNPSRLTRLAGVERGDRRQDLMHLGIGARDFRTWMGQERAARLSYDYGIEPMDMDNPPVLDEVIVDGVMRRGDKMCVAGPSKAYKSFALIQLAIAVACGGRWFGWKCRQGRVLYVNCELRGESFKKRVWEVADAMEGAERAQISENMDVWNMRGRTQPLKTSKEHIVEQAEERRYDVVILDPVYKLFAGDENSAQEVGEFMLAMDELAMRLHASIVYCHHHSKGAKGDVSAQDRFSGSGVFARDCDELVDISPLNLKDHSPTEWGYAANATAWRVETVIRDFEPKWPIDVVFEYPLHHVDETGFLGEFNLYSPQSAGGNKSGERRRDERDRNVAELEEYCAIYYADNRMPLSSAFLAEEFGKSARTIVAWALKAPGLRVEKVKGTNFVVPLTWETNC